MARVSLTEDVLIDPSPPAPMGSTSRTAPVEQVALPRKFTMLNGPAEDAQARELTDTIVALAGLRASKVGMRADVVRALIEIAAGDPKLQAKVAKLLKSRVAPRMTARR